MPDLTDSRLIWIKAILFLVTGTLAATTALLLFPSVRLAILIGVTVWSFARAYYFAFYVIERYIDPTFRFAGLLGAIRYAIRNRVLTRKMRPPEG